MSCEQAPELVRVLVFCKLRFSELCAWCALCTDWSAGVWVVVVGLGVVCACAGSVSVWR